MTAELLVGVRLRQSAKELRLLPKALGDYYGPLETMRRGAEIVVEVFKVGAFRGDSPLAKLGLEIRHYLKMRHDPENLAVRAKVKPLWRNYVWYAAVRHIAPDIFGRGEEAIQTAVGPVADAIDREADRIEAASVKTPPGNRALHDQLTPQAKAILFTQERLKTTGKLPPKTDIAEALGINRRTLNSKNWRAFKVAYAEMKTRLLRSIPSGSADGEARRTD